jgi:S1-C subfamily serine protease
MKKNLYQILGVRRQATGEEIAAAWKAYADNPDASSRAMARDAFQILSDDKQRAAYDASLVAAARRALSSDGTGEPPPPEEEESAVRAIVAAPWFKWVAGALAVGTAIAIWQWRKPAPPTPPAPPVALKQRVVVQGGGAAITVEPVVAAPVRRAMNAEQLFAAVSGSVAMITVGTSAIGSGVVVDRATVITNCHVAQHDGDLQVKVAGKTYSASVTLADGEFDLCRLNVPGLDAAPVALGSVGEVRTGQRVFAIGTPQGLELTLSDGIVSSLRQVPGGTVLQTSAPVSPGSSGGGLFDVYGRLIGVVTFQHRFGQNLNFAVPVDWIGEMRERAGTSRAPGAIGQPPS